MNANFSGNDLAGNGGEAGIFSNAECTEIKGKPNKISGYVDDIVDAGCP